MSGLEIFPKERVALRNSIAKNSIGKIVLVATHIVSDIESIADYIILLYLIKERLWHTIRPKGSCVFSQRKRIGIWKICICIILWNKRFSACSKAAAEIECLGEID